ALPLETPVLWMLPFCFSKVPLRLLPMALPVEIVAEAKIGCRQGFILRHATHALTDFVWRQGVDAGFTSFHPIANCVNVVCARLLTGGCALWGHRKGGPISRAEPVGRSGGFRGADGPPGFVDPHRRRHVYHVVPFRHYVPLVNKARIRRRCRFAAQSFFPAH